MPDEAIFGLVGVLLGSLTTSILTIYKERLTTRHEAALRDLQYERERKSARDAFQRDSIQTLQSAVSELIKSVYAELDRVLAITRESGKWPVRQWETPTAVGWSAAVLLLESSRARVFDDELRSLAAELRTVAGDCIWAKNLEEAKERSKRLEPLQIQFNEAAAELLPSLY
ncbi:hypothetical protein Psi02_78350 [Planotetraspora silvatica]|uniref:Uncharacterized protein n=1 Tax=Planotetraspora silvatica TaxID=234614 RepID=A0A8J3XTB5_9ACTN|nr:hypothetical protein [Planotetraspora silvatica]GII51411.1 hypothetical protein Psi02_78350 [Planotetraspora silvatica]